MPIQFPLPLSFAQADRGQPEEEVGLGSGEGTAAPCNQWARAAPNRATQRPMDEEKTEGMPDTLGIKAMGLGARGEKDWGCLHCCRNDAT